MRRLQQLLNCSYIVIGDELCFKFKGHHFTGKILSGGLIGSCTWTSPGGAPKVIFNEPTMVNNELIIKTFESLTDFTESCIQEKLDEYHTRYSSWKRVRHSRTNTSMETLWKRCAADQRKPVSSTSSEDHALFLSLHERIVSHTAHISMLKERLDQWNKWFVEHHENEEVPVKPVVERVPTPPISTTPLPQPSSAQPLMILNESGQYMVLQKISEGDASMKRWLQDMGLEKFRKELQKYAAQSQNNNMVYPQLTTTEDWSGSIPDNNTVNAYITNFFIRRKRSTVGWTDASEPGIRRKT